MKQSGKIKPNSFLKPYAADIRQDIDNDEQSRHTMALLKILALGNKQIEEGKVRSSADVMKCLRGRRGSP